MTERERIVEKPMPMRLPNGYAITERPHDYCLSKDGYNVLAIVKDSHRNPSFNKALLDFFAALAEQQPAAKVADRLAQCECGGDAFQLANGPVICEKCEKWEDTPEAWNTRMQSAETFNAG